MNQVKLGIFMVLLSFLASAGDKVIPYPYQVKDLDNGLRVIIMKTDFPNIVSLQIPVSVGSRNEIEPGKSGFAHFFEHMMFRGTENYSSAEYDEVLKNIGADQNAYTTDDYTNYHITFSKEDLETVLKLEADRFQNLKYSIEDFKTESRAVLGEYNKNASNPISKMLETLRDTAFKKHTYKHTTIGFLKDIEDMPNQYEYSLKFFDRYYRPNTTTILLAGDLEPESAFALVEKYWGSWKSGTYQADIPTEPEPDGPLYTHLHWDRPTLPWVLVSFRGPAVSDTKRDMAAMDLISNLAFSNSSPLYQRLIIEEQKVDVLVPFFPDHTDPYLLTVSARVKNPRDVWYVRDQIQKELAYWRSNLVSAQRLKDIQSNLKYNVTNELSDTESIASLLAAYIARTRDVETINRIYKLYDSLKPEDLKEKANRYFTDKGMVTLSFSHDELPEINDKVGSVDDHVRANKVPEIQTRLTRNLSPLINFRLLFNVGATSDPVDKEGLANFTAEMIAQGSSQTKSYAQIQEALFPIASEMTTQIDKEMTVFTGQTHVDNLDAFYELFSQRLLQPAWSKEDFERVKAQITNQIKIGLRSNNDEELGKEVLYEQIYKNHPYGHLSQGHLEALDKLSLNEVKAFYQQHYTRANLVFGLAGQFSDSFLERAKRDLGSLPEGQPSKPEIPRTEIRKGLNVTIIEKDVRATAISIGFPIEVNRSHPDFPALWLARSYFGEHRNSNSHLYKRIRKIRGMNYGDYAYIEYFPRGMFQFHPDPNLGRQQQIFQIWIRPVQPQHAHFALRIAKYELDKLVKKGMTQQDFETTRNYLSKFVNVLTKSQDRQLGYELDSNYYKTPEFTQHIKDALAKLTLKEVNRVIKKHLQSKNLEIVMIANDAQTLRKNLINNTPSPIAYESAKPDEILKEDKKLQNYKLKIKAEQITIQNIDTVFR